ncbi:hypothetical protein [uncultured Schumannella sp.]|uniref:hypothetical protein n=1 Tax=uncultured Schumannella sp. TaxID=1195956 RepID=UPI0025D38A0F|nr:hypothetical protein [uncultured Schumannella sp.]
MTHARTSLLVGSLVGGLVLAGSASAALALGGPSDTRTSITVDCDLGEGSNDNQVILPGETLTITLLNCEDWTVDDKDALDAMTVPGEPSPVNSFVVPSGSSSFTFTVDDEADIEVAFEGDDIDIDVYFATPAADPTGSLIVTTRVTMPIVIDDFAVALSETGSDYDLGGYSSCQMEAGYHPYQALPITISTDGDFTFRVIDVTPVDEDVQWGQPYYPSQDFFLAVYTAFDPANPEANLVACNDDRPDDNVSFVNDGVDYISEDQAPEFVSPLTAGEYTLVLTTFRSTSSDDWANGEFSTWSGVSDTTWTPTAMSALFELWGPAGSIALATDDDADAEAEPELAATGTETGAVVVGVMLVAAGGILALLKARGTRRRAA